MSNFRVKVSGLKNNAGEWNSMISMLDDNTDLLESVRNSLSLPGSAGVSVKKTIGDSSKQLKNIIRSSKQMKKTLTEAAQAYEDAEKKILGVSIADKKNDHVSSSDKAWRSGKYTYENGDFKFNAEGGVGVVHGESGHGKYGAHAEGSASALEGKLEYETSYGGGSVEASVLKVSGEVSAGLPDGFSMDDEETKVAGLTASAEAAVLSGSAERYIGSESNNIHANAEGSLVGAGASAEVGLVAGDGNIGVRAEVGAEAYWAKGEVSTGFTILGIDIDIGAEGMVGVQAEASVEAGIAGFDFDLGLGPVGLDVSVDWSDIDLIFWD